MENYRPSPMDLSDVQIPEELYGLTELIAKNVHEVWARQRMQEGWTYGAERDDEKKTSPCIVPYEKLPESEKKYDRDTAFETIKLIVKLGYRITR